MKNISIILTILIIFATNSKAQQANTSSIENLFLEQISNYPQEKIHVQTDRNMYMAGEVIWFRVHLVDALLLKQANASRYVYVELINPLENIVQRVKLIPDSTGCFYGHIQLNEALEEGNYSLRAYTRYMQNQGEDYFFCKSLHVTNPMAETILSSVKFYETNNNINAELSFLSKNEKKKIVPEKCLIFMDGNSHGVSKLLTFKDEVANCSLDSKASAKKNVFLLQTTFSGRVYSRFFTIPCLDKTFDVTFFPEGGHTILSTDIKMAFKAINSNGLSDDISGQIYDDQGNECGNFESLHLGMGSFRMYYSPGRKYHAICVNKQNISKRFDLPELTNNLVSLQTIWNNNNLRVTLAKSPTCKLESQLQLIAHIRGAVIYSQPWNDEQGYLEFDRDYFPAGIVHFLLIDKDRNILTERLVFSSQGSTFANTNIKLDKTNYTSRDKINLSIQVSDENNIPLTGNFSLAVVDKKDADVDTTSSIISTLLLSSELKGYIESPMSYLQKDSKKSSQALDVLMMTQGWRRYDIPDILKGKPTRTLKYSVESSEEITGKAEGVFSALKDGGISLLAVKDSVIGTSFAQPNKNGRFTFKNLEYPDSTRYIIQALTKKGSKTVFLEMDSLKSFPRVSISKAVVSKEPSVNDTYVSKVNQKFTLEKGMRIVNLAEVGVTAKRISRPKTESPYYSIGSSEVLTADFIETWKLLSVFDLLRRIPGVTVSGNEVRYRNGTPMLLLDNIPEENFDYSMLDISDISDAFVSPATSVMPIFGTRASGGAIIINTKKGFIPKNKLNNNIQVVRLLGYQQTAKFYSPMYITEQEKNSSKPDYRTTIYWNPNVQTDSNGIVNLDFYAADFPTQYSIVFEGVSSSGHLIHSSQQEISIETGK